MSCIGGKLSKNKAFELQIEKWNEWKWFSFLLELTRNCDHAGLSFSIEIIGLKFELKIYDVRHWDYKRKRFYERRFSLSTSKTFRNKKTNKNKKIGSK